MSEITLHLLPPLGFRGAGFGIRVSRFAFRVSGFAFRRAPSSDESVFGFRVSGFGFWDLRFRVHGFG